MSRGLPPEAAELVAGAPLMAHLATCVDGDPHVAPVWYHYDDGTLEVLTSGRKLANLRENPRVAVSIEDHDADGDSKWRVTMRGTATVVDDDAAAKAAAERINPKYGAAADAWPENTLVRIDVGSGTYQRY